MICIITNPPDLGRYVEAHNLLKVHSNDTLCHISWADFKGLQPTETLYIIVHGGENSVELSPGNPIGAQTFAKMLVDRGLTSTVKFKKIKLLSCQGGKTMVGGHTPFCQQLADQLPGQGGPHTTVVGYDGNTTNTDEQGKSWAKDLPQTQYPNYLEFKTNLLPKYEAINKHAATLPFTNSAEMKRNAADLAGQSQEVFAWFYKNNAPYLKRIDEHTKDPMAKTYGAPGKTSLNQWKTKV